MNKLEQAKIDKLVRGEKPGSYPFAQIGEVRRDHSLVDPAREAEDWDSRYNRGTVPELALEYFKDKSAPLVDYGAYFGRFLRFMQQHGYTNLHSVDTVDVLNVMDRGSLAGIHEVDLNREPIPYPDEHFAYATAWGQPEHLENPHNFIREVHRTMKMGGIFICSMPNVEHLQTRLVMLKTGELRCYETHNNHIMAYFPGIFAKSFLRYFDLIEKTFMRPHLSLPPYGLFRFISRYLPNNKWFGDHTVYVLRKKPFVPWA